MGRRSANNLPPGIHQSKNGQFWATLEGEDARRWREAHPGRSLPRRRADDLRHARQLQRELARDVENGRDTRVTIPTLKTWVEQWIENKQSLKEYTKLGYRRILAEHITPHTISRMRLTQITPERVQEWIGDLKAKQSKRSGPLSPRTIRNAYALLRAALNTAVDRDMVIKSPCRTVEIPVADNEEVIPLTTEQVAAFFNTVENWDGQPHYLAALYHVAIRCGLRQSELLAIRRSDIDFDKKYIRVNSQLRKGERTSTKTRNSNRIIPISDKLIERLQQHLSTHNDELVFINQSEKPLTDSNLRRHFRIVLKRASLPETIVFHHLRHTYAALQIAAGTDIYTLSRLLGHSSIGVTANTYGHLYDAGKRAAAVALERLLEGE